MHTAHQTRRQPAEWPTALICPHWHIPTVPSLFQRLTRLWASERSTVSGSLKEAEEWIGAGSLNEAESLCDRELAATPRASQWLHLKGVICLQRGDAAAARSWFAKALDLDDQAAVVWQNDGTALAMLQRFPEAIAAFERCLQLDPTRLDAHHNLSGALLDAGRPADAIKACRQYLAQEPGRQPSDRERLAHLAAEYHQRGLASESQPLVGAAVDLLSCVVANSPAAAPAAWRITLVEGLMLLKRYDEAWKLLPDLADELPADVKVQIDCANCLTALGRATEAREWYLRALRHAPTHLPLVSSCVAALDYACLPPEENLRQRRSLMQSFPRGTGSAVPERVRTDGRLRVGYVSPDLRQHIVTLNLFEPVMRAHDKARFDWFVYDAVPSPDAKNAELRKVMPNWREITGLSAEQAASLIRRDQIDVLVDLAGHTIHNRLDVFALRPAPVQASWLGYAGSTGLPEMDWLISDPYTSPPESDTYVSERVWRLPDTRFCYRPLNGAPEPRMPPDNGTIVFGCFNNHVKLNVEVLSTWAKILERVPESVLWIKNGALGYQQARIAFAQDLAEAGIDVARVRMEGWEASGAILDLYSRMHIALDPFPFCGGLTSFDALWMGVPVVTLEQPLMAGRQTLAMLRNMGHGELVAADAEAYVELAVTLAQDMSRFARYRRDLREAFANSALARPAQLAPNLEAAYSAMAGMP